MALDNTTFVTVAEVKAMLDESGSTWDTIIETLINACTKWCMDYCGGRRFLAPPSDETEYYDGNDSNKIFLRNFPIKSIASISYRSGGDYSNPTWTAFSAATDYIKDDRLGIIHFNSIPKGIQNIKVVYKGGYDGSSDIGLSALKLAITQAVTKEFNRRKSKGMLSESVGGASVSWSVKPDEELTAILDNYRVFLP